MGDCLAAPTPAVVHVHPDAASLEHHMEVAGPAFEPFVELVELTSIRVYGDPGEKAVAQLRGKAEMLGSAAVSIQVAHAGFARSGSR